MRHLCINSHLRSGPVAAPHRVWASIVCIIVALFFLTPHLALAQNEASIAIDTDGVAERLGELRLTDFMLEPNFMYSEPQNGQFQPGNSFLSVSWFRDGIISGRIALGTKALLGVPARYGTVADQELGVVEAFAQAETHFGRIRMGLIPLAFGGESAGGEQQLRFSRSQVYQKRMLGLRDYGLSYAIDNNGFFVEWALHNGESGKDLDNQAWMTARWGYRYKRQGTFWFSGATGRTTPQATSPLGTSASGGTGLGDVNRSSKIRIANIGFSIVPSWFSVMTEATLGDAFQDPVRYKFFAWHSDFDIRLTDKWGMLLRYDHFDPRLDQTSDRIEEATLGFVYRSLFETSSIYFYGTKSFKEDVHPDAHIFRIVWRLTPYAKSPNDALALAL